MSMGGAGNGARAALAVLLWSGCVSPLAGFPADALAPRDARNERTLGDAEARVLLDETWVRFEERDGVAVARTFNRRRVRVGKSEAANDWAVQRSAFYNRTFETIDFHQARVTTADNAHTTVIGDEAKELVDLPALGTYVLYSSSRTRTLAVPRLAPGTVVETVTLSTTRTPELFSFGQFFGAAFPVDEGVLVVDAPAAWDVEFDVAGAGTDFDVEPAVKLIGDRRQWRWRRTNAAAVLPEAASVSMGERVPSVLTRLLAAQLENGQTVVGPKDARDLSRTMFRLQAGRAEPTAALRTVVENVLGPRPQDVPQRERAAKLYAWTRDSIRYCAVEIGMGGWIPHAASDVEAARYGDCKDKANLLKALLEVADVPSRAVGIYSGMPVPFRLPVVGANFNHEILVVDLDDGPVFVDPTTRVLPFGDLPWNDEERVCLPSEEQGSLLILTPSSSEATTSRVTTLKLRQDEGMLVGSFKMVRNGSHADALRDGYVEAPEAERPKLIADLVPLSGARVKAFEVVGVAPPLEVTPVVVTGEVTRPLVANVTLLDAAALLDRPLPLFTADRAHSDVAVRHRETLEDNVELTLPGRRVRRLPPPASSTSAHLDWSLAWEDAGDRTVLRRRVVWKSVRVPAGEVAALRAQIDAYHQAAAARAIFELDRATP